MNKLLIFSRRVGVVFFLLFSTARAASNNEDNQVIHTIAFGSCEHQSRNQNFWDPILKSKPDLFIFAGDTIYSDTYDMSLMRRKYAQLEAQPGFRQLKVTCPIMATWDDHDFGLNDSGDEFPDKAGAQKNFLDFWDVPKSSPRRSQEGVYNAEIFGPKNKRVQVIMLDTRYFRSPLKMLATRKPEGGRYKANYDKDATLLGEEQWKWLENQLEKPADLRIFVSSIQLVAQDHNWERWMNFPNERARLFDLFKKLHTENLIVLSGDRHHAELSKMDDAIGYPLYDLTASGLNMARNHPIYEPNRYRVGKLFPYNHFGVLKIDWEAEEPKIVLQIRDVKGSVQIEDTVKFSELKWHAPKTVESRPEKNRKKTD